MYVVHTEGEMPSVGLCREHRDKSLIHYSILLTHTRDIGSKALWLVPLSDSLALRGGTINVGTSIMFSSTLQL